MSIMGTSLDQVNDLRHPQPRDVGGARDLYHLAAGQRVQARTHAVELPHLFDPQGGDARPAVGGDLDEPLALEREQGPRTGVRQLPNVRRGAGSRVAGPVDPRSSAGPLTTREPSDDLVERLVADP